MQCDRFPAAPKRSSLLQPCPSPLRSWTWTQQSAWVRLPPSSRPADPACVAPTLQAWGSRPATRRPSRGLQPNPSMKCRQWCTCLRQDSLTSTWPAASPRRCTTAASHLGSAECRIRFWLGHTGRSDLLGCFFNDYFVILFQSCNKGLKRKRLTLALDPALPFATSTVYFIKSTTSAPPSPEKSKKEKKRKKKKLTQQLTSHASLVPRGYESLPSPS